MKHHNISKLFIMKIVSKLLILSALIATIYSCQEAPKMIGGFKYETTKKGGEVAKVGEYAYVAITIKDQNDSILQEMTKGPNMPMFKIPANPILGAQANPIQDLAAVIGVGGKATIFMPVDSLNNLPANIMAMDYITYNMEITKVETEEEYQAEIQRIKDEQEAAQKEVIEVVNADLEIFKVGMSDLIMTTPEGLKYIMHDEGNGAQGEAGKLALVDYYGVFLDGEMFDNSYRSGRPFQFTVGRQEAISGWDLAIPLLKEGGNATIYVPYTLAYGEAGRPPVIPVKTDLVFHVALRTVK